MSTQSTSKKITRGISKDFADAFKKSDLYDLYTMHKDELFLGVRNNYLNIYYDCDSIAKVKFKKGTNKLVCEIDQYYLYGNSTNKRVVIDPAEIKKNYTQIKNNSNVKSSNEKKVQSRLVINNNANVNSNWFCIDVEYVKQYNDIEEKRSADFNGRFDIIAISKKIPHKVALIELKYGSHAIGGSSGIYKHVSDFSKFVDKGYFDSHLSQEIIEIIKSQKDLGITIPFAIPEKKDLLKPEFYFIILNNNAHNKASTPQQTLSGYLFKDKRWGCKKLTSGKCVETDFGDITTKKGKFHATFLFSSETKDNLKIEDIIDGNYLRIEPQ